eukprot:1481218-Amphidinium_carterae.1
MTRGCVSHFIQKQLVLLVQGLHPDDYYVTRLQSQVAAPSRTNLSFELSGRPKPWNYKTLEL